MPYDELEKAVAEVITELEQFSSKNKLSVREFLSLRRMVRRAAEKGAIALEAHNHESALRHPKNNTNHQKVIRVKASKEEADYSSSLNHRLESEISILTAYLNDAESPYCGQVRLITINIYFASGNKIFSVDYNLDSGYGVGIFTDCGIQNRQPIKEEKHQTNEDLLNKLSLHAKVIELHVNSIRFSDLDKVVKVSIGVEFTDAKSAKLEHDIHLT